MDPDRFIGVQSKIVVGEAYAKGLEGLETGMELLVLFAFHLSSRAPLMVHPRGDTSRKKRGVFATCSPNRPTGIGTGHCKLLGRDGNILVVEDLEAINGSPVIDINPSTACVRCERDKRSAHLKSERMKDVRPTTSIVIEAIFNILGPLSNVAFLDLFAGTGRVALEAWSRGARPVVAVELLRRRCEAVKRAGVKPEEGLVLLFMDVRRAIRWLDKRGYSFNVIFADPPYDLSWATENARTARIEKGSRPPRRRYNVGEVEQGDSKTAYPNAFNSSMRGGTAILSFRRLGSRGD
jgi:tRNA-Thr(GGU) m(6)t(6)A37 methyltransferase TsaA